MSFTNYELYLTDVRGNVIAGPLIEPERLEWSIVLGDIGVCTLEIAAADWNPAWFDHRLLLQVWRQPRFISSPVLVQSYWLMNFGKRMRKNSPVAWIKGYDMNMLLMWRIINGAAESAEAEKSGDAVAIMGEYFTEAALTDIGRDYSAEFDLSVQTQGTGASIEYSASRGKLLSVLRGCQGVADAESGPVRFWVQALQNGALLKISETPWGEDRLGLRPFSPEFGTLFDPEWEDRSAGTSTFAYVGGQGQKAARNVQEVDLSDGTVVGRREMWCENTQIVVDANLSAWGKARLWEQRPRLLMQGELRDTELSAFGRDWNLGDAVWCEFDGKAFESEVLAVTGVVTPNAELISAKVEGEA